MSPVADVSADAEQAAAYVVSRVAARAGSRLRQGARKVPLSTRPLGVALDVVASTRLLGVSQPVATALVAWGEGKRRVRLLTRVPLAREVLGWQALAERCVSLLPEGTETAPHEDGLAFAMHDLCHLEKFVDPEHHLGQVGFFRAVHEASRGAAWGPFVARFDHAFGRELDHVVADMNGSAVFLFAALKMKLKMAVRRRVARESAGAQGGATARVSAAETAGLEAAVSGGPLDARELEAFDAELGTLLDLLAVDGPPRVAALRVRTRRDEREAALLVLRYFESKGAATLSAR